MPAAVDLAAYRIIQESLTNVARHAARATATVRLGYGPDGLDIEVSDDGRSPAANGSSSRPGPATGSPACVSAPSPSVGGWRPGLTPAGGSL